MAGAEVPSRTPSLSHRLTEPLPPSAPVNFFHSGYGGSSGGGTGGDLSCIPPEKIRVSPVKLFLSAFYRKSLTGFSGDMSDVEKIDKD